MTEEYIRLHITPFNPSLLNAILPLSILPSARNISYHKIQTFPEKSYGYVDLPVMDADKIKKKLNGAILKGTKVKIDKARSQKEILLAEAEGKADEKAERPKKEKKKRKRDELPGVDIGLEGRQVKRGWTTPGKDIPKDKLKVIPKSKFTTGPECLFKTVLPPNVASKGKVVEVKPEKTERRKKKAGKEALVHEFTKTTKYATFLRSNSGPGKSKAVTEYVEGKGWVDEDGNIIEAEVKSNLSKHTSKIQATLPSKVASEDESSNDSEDEDDAEAQEGLEPVIAEESSHDMVPESAVLEEVASGDVSSDAESSPDGSSASEDSADEAAASVRLPATISAADIDKPALIVQASMSPSEASSSSDALSDEDSTSSSSSDEDSESENMQSPTPTPTSSRPQSAAGPSLTIKIPESPASTPIAVSVHPLEALYKRQKKNDSSTPKPEASTFSFFGADDNDDDIEVETHMQVPLTPYTQRDFESRGMRSAAPTPDTAHANKKFVWPSRDGADVDEDEDGEPEASSPIRASAKTEEKDTKTGEESDFQKWFWENRGNVNRAWKKRKRTVSKEKRQRESKKRHVA